MPPFRQGSVENDRLCKLQSQKAKVNFIALKYRWASYQPRYSDICLLSLYRPGQAWTGPWGCRSLRLPGFLDIRYMKAEKSAQRTVRLYPSGNIPGTHFCGRLSRPQGHSATGTLKSMKNNDDPIGNRTRDMIQLPLG